MKGDYSSISKEAQGQDYASLSVDSHYNVCKAFLSLQRITKLDECMAPLWKRAYVENFSAGNTTYTKDFIDILLNNIEANKFIELGEFDQALAHATKSFEATKRDPRMVMGETLAFLSTFTSLGRNNPNSKNSRLSEYSRTLASAEALGLMATIETLRKNPEQAEKFRGLLRTLYAQTGKSNVDNKGGHLSLVRRWLAQSYYIAGDYESAFDIVTRDDRSGATKAYDALLSGLLFIEQPLLEPVSYAFFGTNIDDLGFVSEFPMRIMLYRSALKTGRLDVARKGYDALLAEERMKNFGSLYFRLLHERFQMSLASGEIEAAEGFLKRAIDLLEEQRSQLERESHKLGFIGDKLAVYADIVRLLVSQGRHAEAFEYAERGKSRALVDLLASKQDFGPEGANARTLLSELARQERESRRYGAAAKGTATRSAKDTMGRIKASSAELGSLVSVSATSTADIQSRLRPDEALVEYFYREGEAYAFVVRNGTVKSYRISADGLHDDVAEFRDAINDYRSGAWKEYARRLHRRLIAPVMASLDGVRHLTIVPHGVLHYLPFNAIGDGQLLIQRFTVRLLPSASTLEYLEKKRTPTADLLVFGNPDLGDPALDLPGAEQEANDVARLWKGARVLFRKSASESVAKNATGAFRFVHFASHGEFNPDEPLKSRMLLSPDGENDGNLTVSEIYDLTLNADMVTLSACQTGLGDVKNGDDVVGLNRGFLYAGAQSVVASLWSVPDESTRDLMTAFYGNLKSMDQRSALQKAQISTREKYKHPIFWAAFQMTGGR